MVVLNTWYPMLNTRNPAGIQMVNTGWDTVCDETENLTETGSGTFFRYQIFSETVPGLFSVPNSLRDRFRDFFRYQIFFETDSETFFGTKFFRDRFRDFFRYQIFFETGSETFFGTKFFRYRFRYHQIKWQIPGNGNSRDRDVTLCREVGSVWSSSSTTCLDVGLCTLGFWGRGLVRLPVQSKSAQKPTVPYGALRLWPVLKSAHAPKTLNRIKFQWRRAILFKHYFCWFCRHLHHHYNRFIL